MFNQRNAVMITSRSIAKFILPLALLVLLGCRFDGQCVYGDDWGQYVSRTVIIDPNREFTDSGISVAAAPAATPFMNEEMMDDTVYAEVSGAFNLCPAGIVLSPTHPIYPISPKISDWQPTGVYVRGGDRVVIEVDGAYTDKDAQQTEGRGLYAMIYDPDVFGGGGLSPNNGTENDLLYWPVTPNQRDLFFEIYNDKAPTVSPAVSQISSANATIVNAADTGGPIASYSVPAGLEGQVWLRYARNAERGDGVLNPVFAEGATIACPFDTNCSALNWNFPTGTDRYVGIDRWDHTDEDDSQYSPWHGDYVWMDKCSGCYVPRLLGGFRPNIPGTACCQGGVGFAICSASIAKRDYFDSGGNERCREPGGDHWVNGDYANNLGGYTISIGEACPRFDGEGLELWYVEDAQENDFSEPLYVYKSSGYPCETDSDACEPKIGAGGVIETKKVKRPSGSSLTVDLGTVDIPAGVIAQGVYRGVPPSTARNNVWFRLIDRAFVARDYTSEPPGCDDPSDSNYVGAEAAPKGYNPANPLPCHQFQVPIPALSPPVDPTEVLGGLTIPAGTTAATATGNTFTGTICDPNTYDPKVCKPRKGWTGYRDNVGNYTVNLSGLRPLTGFTSVVPRITVPVHQQLFGQCDTPALADEIVSQMDCGGSANWRPGLVEVFFEDVVESGIYIDAVRATLMLFIVLFGYLYMLGMIRQPARFFVVAVFKFVIVLMLTFSESWRFFYVHFFSFFIDGVDHLITMIAGPFLQYSGDNVSDPIIGTQITDTLGTQVNIGEDNPFAFADIILNRFFSGDTFAKLAGVLFSDAIGWIIFFALLIGIFMYLFAIIAGIVLYLLAKIAITFLVALGPLMIVFILFERTRALFDIWWKMLLSFTLQPALVIASLAIFSMFVYAAMYNALNFTVCWGCLIPIQFNIPKLNIELGEICVFYFYKVLKDPGSTGVFDGAIAISSIIIFLIFVNALMMMVVTMSKVASELTTGSTGSAAGSRAVAVASLPFQLAGAGLKMIGGGVGKPLGNLLKGKGKKGKK